MTTRRTKRAKAWLNWYHNLTPEEKLAHNQKRYERYPAQYRMWRDKWAVNNPHKMQASAHHTQLKKNYPEIWAKTEITNASLADWLKEKRGSPCAYCGEPGNHIDHKIPLSLGGDHVWSNLQICCEFCNLAKRNNTEEEFLRKIRLIMELQNLKVV